MENTQITITQLQLREALTEYLAKQGLLYKVGTVYGKEGEDRDKDEVYLIATVEPLEGVTPPPFTPFSHTDYLGHI